MPTLQIRPDRDLTLVISRVSASPGLQHLLSVLPHSLEKPAWRKHKLLSYCLAIEVSFRFMDFLVIQDPMESYDQLNVQ